MITHDNIKRKDIEYPQEHQIIPEHSYPIMRQEQLERAVHSLLVLRVFVF